MLGKSNNFIGPVSLETGSQGPLSSTPWVELV